MYSPYKKGFASVVLLLVAVIVVVSFFLYSNKDTFLQRISKGTNVQSQEAGLRIEGDKVYDGVKELFYNVSNVSEVRYGPDGKSIQFKLTDKEKSGDQVVCANLTPVQDEHNKPGYQTIGPWDYKFIGDTYPIRRCGTLTGYLTNSDMFSYLTIKDQTATFFIDMNNVLHQIPLDQALSSRLLEKQKQQYTGDTYVQNLGFVKEENENNYIFPWSDSYIVNNKLLIAFGSMILDIDTKNEKILGYQSMLDKPYKDSIIADYFWFETKKDVPLVLVNAAWEGNGTYQAIVDFSGDGLKITPLVQLDKGGNDWNHIRKFEWVDGGLNLSLYTEKDVSNEVSDLSTSLYPKYYHGTKEEDIDIDKLNTESQKRMQAKYDIVTCVFNPGITIGCYASLDIRHYRYEPGGELKKL